MNGKMTRNSKSIHNTCSNGIIIIGIILVLLALVLTVILFSPPACILTVPQKTLTVLIIIIHIATAILLFAIRAYLFSCRIDFYDNYIQGKGRINGKIKKFHFGGEEITDFYVNKNEILYLVTQDAEYEIFLHKHRFLPLAGLVINIYPMK